MLIIQMVNEFKKRHKYNYWFLRKKNVTRRMYGDKMKCV